MSDIKTELENLGDTSDYTGHFDPQDIASNKVMGVLAYIGILVLIPLFAAKTSPFARFHTNQGLILFIAAIAVNIINWLLGGIPILGTIIAILCWILDLGIFILAILGIVNVVQGKAKDLPLIGSIRILS